MNHFLIFGYTHGSARSGETAYVNVNVEALVRRRVQIDTEENRPRSGNLVVLSDAFNPDSTTNLLHLRVHQLIVSDRPSQFQARSFGESSSTLSRRTSPTHRHCRSSLDVKGVQGVMIVVKSLITVRKLGLLRFTDGPTLEISRSLVNPSLLNLE